MSKSGLTEFELIRELHCVWNPQRNVYPKTADKNLQRPEQYKRNRRIDQLIKLGYIINKTFSLVSQRAFEITPIGLAVLKKQWSLVAIEEPYCNWIKP